MSSKITNVPDPLAGYLGPLAESDCPKCGGKIIYRVTEGVGVEIAPGSWVPSEITCHKCGLTLYPQANSSH